MLSPVQWTFGTIAVLAKRERQLCGVVANLLETFGAHSSRSLPLIAPDDDFSLQSSARSTSRLQGSRSGEGSQLAHEDLSLLHVGRSHPFACLSSAFTVCQASSGQSRGLCSLNTRCETKSGVLLSPLRLPCSPSSRLVSSGVDRVYPAQSLA